MSFLFPAALTLAVAVAVPILLHLRRAPTERRIPFPAVRYLRLAERSRSRALRLRDLLLMGLRTGALALAALAAAGPLVGRGGGSEHPPTDVVIVLDNSASTGRIVDDRTSFELLRELALASVALAGAADRFWVFPTVGPPLALGVGPAEAAAGLRRAGLTDGFGAVSRVLERALRSLPDGDRHREAHLLSDLQATGFSSLATVDTARVDGSAPSASSSDPAASGAVIPLLVPILSGLPERNTAVTFARSSEGSDVPAGVPIFVEVEAVRFSGGVADAAAPRSARPTSDAAGDSARVRVDLDGTTVDAATGLWGERLVVSLPPLDVGAHHIRVEQDPSGLRADDSRHLVLQARDAPSVLLIGPQGSFLSTALESLGEADRAGGGMQMVRIFEFGPEVTVRRRPMGDASAVIYIPPVDPVELPRFNQALAAASIPWTLTPDVARGELGILPTREASRGAVSLAEARILRRYLLERTGPAGDDSVLIRTSAGDPWLARGDAPDGRGTGSRYLVLASALDPSATTIPTTALMVPFVERLLQWATAEAAEDADFRAGEIYAVPAGTDSVRLPDGAVLRVDAGVPVLLSRTGLYVLYRDTRPLVDTLLLAANVPPEEQDLAALGPAELSARLPDLEVLAVEGGAKGWSRQIFRSRRGRDATASILGVVALLLVIETLVVTPGRGDREAA